jgi:hypothetical protein
MRAGCNGQATAAQPNAASRCSAAATGSAFTTNPVAAGEACVRLRSSRQILKPTKKQSDINPLAHILISPKKRDAFDKKQLTHI